MKFYRIKRVSGVRNCVILEGDAALVRKLQEKGERAHLTADGVALETDDKALVKAADGRYKALIFTQSGEPMLVDNPNAPTGFRMLKRAGGSTSSSFPTFLPPPRIKGVELTPRSIDWGWQTPRPQGSELQPSTIDPGGTRDGFGHGGER